MSAALFPQRAPIDEQLRWAVKQRDLARYRYNAWKHRHASLSAMVRRLRRDAAIPDADYDDFEDNDE